MQFFNFSSILIMECAAVQTDYGRTTVRPYGAFNFVNDQTDIESGVNCFL